MNHEKLKQPTIILRGKNFTQNDLEIIQKLVKKHFDKGRTFISKSVCEELDWKQPNGWLKERACREVLVRLEKEGFISLPLSAKKTKISQPENKEKESLKCQEKTEENKILIEYPSEIKFELAKGNKGEKTWNEIVEKHHYLGHKVVVGRCLKYLIKSNNNILSAIAFSSPAWHLKNRNIFLKKIGIEADNIRDLVINNSRFLILPNIKIPNLASTILSAATQQVAKDWLNYYSIKPLIVETFVQPSLYSGICYKAANWIEIGLTKGYAKKGSSFHNSQEPKQIFLYGLDKRTRRKMLNVIAKDKKTSE